MIKYSWLLRFPSVYAWLSSKRCSVNYEKLLYLRSIQKGDVIFDIGANIGYYSLLFSKLCGKNGFVHSFEPVPETYQLLVRTRKLKNAKANNLAAGDSDETLNMSYDPEIAKRRRLSLTLPPRVQLEVKVLPLDTYAEKIKLEKLNFIKCDGGFELKALKGTKHTLAKHLPRLSIEITLDDETRKEL